MLNFNPDINVDNFNIFKRKNKIIVTEIIPFLNDFMQILYFNSQTKIDNETEIPTYDGDKKVFESYTKSILSSFREQYVLNVDVYNFKNEFFDIRKKDIEKSRIPRNVVIKNISINRRYMKFNIEFDFICKMAMNKKLHEEKLKIVLNYAFFDKDQKFNIDKSSLIKLNEKFTLQNHEEAVKIYEEFVEYQNNVVSEYNSKVVNFLDKCVNGDNKESSICI